MIAKLLILVVIGIVLFFLLIPVGQLRPPTMGRYLVSSWVSGAVLSFVVVGRCSRHVGFE